MARTARLIVPGTALHVVQRGHDRRPCFRLETDYLVYLANLRDTALKSGCAVHAYCLMTNHVHLLVTPQSESACAWMMRNLGQRYAQYFNRRHGRSGALWEGRFRSCLVDSPSYVFACYRYIEMNPVRAGMVTGASAYPWSSYEGNVGRVRNQLLTPHAEYLALGDCDDDRRQSYERFFACDEDTAFLSAVRAATKGGYALIGDDLKSRLSAEAKQRLDRKPPGPRPTQRPVSTGIDIQAELGLRPRSG